ncbi:hypothetical protein NA78x_000077 [Anatilimnocola sp. NA78]|uniref:ParE family toxin-like protein n=1 Tax=Anatilimnocola sp. NA78 TaxID=3415683 RepID=UPI003CE563E1
MTHRATPRFWACYRDLPVEIQQLADRCYELLRRDPRHPSLHFKKIHKFWSVRVGLHYRALAVEEDDDFMWVWIGTHAEYDGLLS